MIERKKSFCEIHVIFWLFPCSVTSHLNALSSVNIACYQSKKNEIGKNQTNNFRMSTFISYEYDAYGNKMSYKIRVLCGHNVNKFVLGESINSPIFALFDNRFCLRSKESIYIIHISTKDRFHSPFTIIYSESKLVFIWMKCRGPKIAWNVYRCMSAQVHREQYLASLQWTCHQKYWMTFDRIPNRFANQCLSLYAFQISSSVWFDLVRFGMRKKKLIFLCFWDN